MAKKEKKEKKQEFAKEVNAKDLSWELFKKTNDVNYYRLYSALKDDKSK